MAKIVITRDGEPITRLIPSSNKSYEFTETQRAGAAAAVERMRERAKSLPQEPFDWEAMKAGLGRSVDPSRRVSYLRRCLSRRKNSDDPFDR